jgi:hypothetical protein
MHATMQYIGHVGIGPGLFINRVVSGMGNSKAFKRNLHMDIGVAM